MIGSAAARVSFVDGMWLLLLLISLSFGVFPLSSRPPRTAFPFALFRTTFFVLCNSTLQRTSTRNAHTCTRNHHFVSSNDS